MILFSFISYLICKITDGKCTEILVRASIKWKRYLSVVSLAVPRLLISPRHVKKVDMTDIFYFRYSYRAFC